MKMSTRARIGLIFGILLFGLLVVPVCASDDSSWLRPDSLDEILEWLQGSSQDLWTVPGDTGNSLPTPSLRTIGRYCVVHSRFTGPDYRMGQDDCKAANCHVSNDSQPGRPDQAL